MHRILGKNANYEGSRPADQPVRLLRPVPEWLLCVGDAGAKIAVSRGDPMSEHTATVHWHRNADADFARNRYSRAHEWRFDGGAVVPASASPAVVRAPFSDPAGVDPEEAFVAAVASCHMLWFLSIAAAKGHVVDRYEDEAVGTMAKNADGKEWVADVLLRPRIAFGGESTPDESAIEALHHEAHAECFIANSVKSAIRIEPRA
jgi:organic hydroperoxide reductase OsmC/OhrA